MHSILAARTHFSIGESILKPDKIVERAKELGEKAVAITDTMSVTGLVNFTNAAKKAEIKPVVGVRLRLTDNPTWRPDKTKKEKKKDMPRTYFLTVYARTEEGMKVLYRLLTLGNSEDRFYYESKLGFDDLLKELQSANFHSDLSIVLGDTNGILEHPNADDLIDKFGALVEHVYAPLIPIDTPYFSRLNELSIRQIDAGRAKPIVIRPAFYDKNEADVHEIMKAVSANTAVSDPWHRSTYNRDFHLLGVHDLVAQVRLAGEFLKKRGVPKVADYLKDGLVNTQALVDSISYQWSKAPVTLPKMAQDEFAEVKRLCVEGWKRRFADDVFGHKPSQQDLVDVYKPRLAYELEILKKLDFSGYFLLVMDVVDFSKSNGILVGPGRGSVGGSLVAYLMGITDCDPIRFNLLFERFINPDRIDLPDIDLDFMSTRRGEIVDYLTKKYGENRVAGVSNYGVLAAASCIRDIGRVLGLTERDTRCSKLVPKLHGANVPLPACAEQVPDIKEFSEKYASFWKIMTELEGTMRNYGQHAAGVVVAGVDLIDRGVVEKRKENSSVICWDKRIVEDQGLVKMDVLGLSTLDLIKLTLDYIFERTGKKLDLTRIPIDDPEVLENFAKGQIMGVFQFDNSSGMKRLLKELGKDGTITFDDISAATGLFRPGPIESGMMDSYYLRKQGLEMVEYDHPLMEPILSSTYGVIVYQEQVMQVSRAVAGYTAPEADHLRKIMGKKLPEEMKKERGKFVDGCVNTVGCTEEWAGELFDKIEGFAGYGFNKSHSVEYSLISWQSMWLKTKFPVEFFAATLSLLDEDKLPALIRDAERYGIDVSMPDINISSDRFEIATDVRLVVPFSRIKGVGPKAVQAILKARQAGPFTSKQDFIDRVEKRSCNSKVQDLLDRVGAFCRIEPGQLPAKDPTRIMDLIELLPGLITDAVPINRDMHHDKESLKEILRVVENYRAAHGPTGDSDGYPIKPSIGKKCRFMIITDAPTGQEEENGFFSIGMSVACVIDAMAEHDIGRGDFYWTGLIKRPKAEKQVTPEEIGIYKQYLDEEISILEPPVIVMMGSQTVRHFIPDFKGKASDAAGKVIYSKEYDANLVVGFNPGEIYFDPTKQTQMEEIFKSVVDLLS